MARTLQYDRCTPEMQARILDARRAEWSKYRSFNAAMPIRGKELEELLQEGHVPIPMQWVDVDKQAHLTGTPEHQPENRSRLVACGNHEQVSRDAQGIRCDSPTAETEGHMLIASFAASHRVTLYAADVSSAYFQSQPMTRFAVAQTATWWNSKSGCSTGCNVGCTPSDLWHYRRRQRLLLEDEW